MLSSISHKEKKVIKQGFLYKRGGSGIIAKWRLKFAVLYRTPDACMLELYDKRSQSVPPKHLIDVQSSYLEVPSENVNGKLLATARFTKASADHPFIINGDRRKFLLSAQTRSERDEWILALSRYIKTVPGTMNYQPRPKLEGPSPNRNLTRQLSALNIAGKARVIDDDNMSTFSDDSCFSSVTTASRRNSMAQHHYDNESIRTGVESLSFCSEPVLTPAELSSIGVHETNRGKDDKHAKRRAINPNINHAENWNEQYQALLTSPTHDDEGYLKKDLAIVEIVGIFQEVAQNHVRALIDDLHWKKPEGNDLLCGSEIKRDGIKFKLISNYQGLIEEIESQLAKSNHELQGIDMINSCGEGINTHLTTLVDYKGVRVIATADIHQEQCHLSFELQSENPRTDEWVSSHLQSIGKSLNFKPHAVMLHDDRRVTINIASSVQAYHDQLTNHHYLVNLSEIIPLDYVGGSNPIPHHRLRPEFLRHYPTPLCADAFTNWSATNKKEKDVNDSEVLTASRYLREHWIPSFVKKLDELEIRPINSSQLSSEFHKAGVNMRYLGLVAQLSKLPLIKDICLLEMLARSVKTIFHEKIRGAILHFRNVGATMIEEEMKNYGATMFSLALGNSDKSIKFFKEKLRDEVKRKFGYEMTTNQWLSLHRPAIFLALQYHCGLVFEDDMDYEFEKPLNRSKIIGFIPKSKSIWSKIPKFVDHTTNNGTEAYKTNLPIEEIIAYQLARHFKSVGPSAKLSRLESSAKALVDVAAYYNACGRYEEAKMYAQSACNAAQQNTALQGLAQAQLIESLIGMQPNGHVAPDPAILSIYQKALTYVEWHWGTHHPWVLSLHDRMTSVYIKSGRPQQSFEFHKLSMDITMSSLGKQHAVTAGYLIKAGIIMSTLQNTQECYQYLNDAMHIYQAIHADTPLIAETHYHLAEVLVEKGDFDGSVSHAQKCKKLREKAFGQQDPRTIESYMQLSRLIMAPYVTYKGVITPQIRTAYKEVIYCHEKVFRFLKACRSSGNGDTISLAPRRSISQISMLSSAKPMRTNATFSTNGVNKFVIPHIAGPYFSAPYAPLTPINRGLLHKLTTEIVRLKLELLDQPNHKECVRMLRQEQQEHQAAISPEDARTVILRLAAVSPSVYMDGIMARIDDEDEEAIDELAVVLQLTENEVVGLTQ